MPNKFEYIDLFSGCGGLSLGMHLASWKAKFAIEKNEDAFKTLSYNLIEKNCHFDWPNWLPVQAHDINEILNIHKEELIKLKGTIKLVAGGPPCQGFSSAGKRNEKDARNKLVDSYLKFIDLVEPEAIFFENVKGFTMTFKTKSKKEKKYSEYVVKQLKKRKYRVSFRMVDFSEFGIPQKRNRFILFACKNKNPDAFFEYLYSGINSYLQSHNLSRYVGVKEAIADLEKQCGTIVCPDSKRFLSGTYGVAKSQYQKYCRKGTKKSANPDSHRFANHKKDTLKRFNELQNLNLRNKNLSDILKDSYSVNKNCICVLDENLPSPTITTHPDDHIHYSESRILTVREYARLQSFPDWYEFKGKYTTGGERRRVDVPRYTQIGNAIPPIFAEQVGIALEKFFM